VIDSHMASAAGKKNPPPPKAMHRQHLAFQRLIGRSGRKWLKTRQASQKKKPCKGGMVVRSGAGGGIARLIETGLRECSVLRGKHRLGVETGNFKEKWLSRHKTLRPLWPGGSARLAATASRDRQVAGAASGMRYGSVASSRAA